MTANPTTTSTPRTTTTNDQPTTRSTRKATSRGESSKARTDQFQPPHYKITTTTYLCITIRWAVKHNAGIEYRGRTTEGGPAC
jgi:hypothetical protein